jgi:hypothetical protein
MSPRRLRFEARMFRGESVAFEACAGFRGLPTAGAEAGAEPDVCHCGWLEDDHHYRARVPARSPSSSQSARWRRVPVGLPIAAFGRRTA